MQANIDALSKLTEETQDAAEKCRRIYRLDEADVKLALEARKNGGLEDRINRVSWQQLVSTGL